jgi:hypothetical protein
MADHLWFIPVSGGNADDPSDKFINVQWGSGLYGAPAIAPVTAAIEAGVTFQGGGGEGEAKIGPCCGKWSWTSEQSGGNMTKGSQLGVGTVFAKQLVTPAYLWSTTEFWAKFKVSDKDKLSRVWISLCDSGGNSVSSEVALAGITNNQWKVFGKSRNAMPDTWAMQNLRGVLTFQGTTDAQQVGELIVYVEWFAFRLSGQQ